MQFLKCGVLSVVMTCTLLSCQPVPKIGDTLRPIPGKVVCLADSAQAALRIQSDDKEGFFEQISNLDIRLQMGVLQNTSIDETELRQSYPNFLAQQAMPFEPEERVLLQNVFQTAYAYCDTLNPHLLPDTIYLAKMDTRVFGPSVYFTREETIFIPENELYVGNQALLPVMLHELFHIISRYQPELRNELYALIGYYQLDALLHFPTPLLQKRLLNPDGINHQYAIELQDSLGETQPYISVISADTSNFNPGKRYFDYIDFRLHALQSSDSGYTVEAEGTLPENATGFFEQIADNTGYIIHPDEILADNFVLLVLQYAGAQGYSDRPLSEQGKALQLKMKQVLKF
ncbi:MAG: hypothetical protein KI786_12590 [Mameliella sp.]|nr:hypothetical protein [Phaeodactylibacter sp.]